MTRKVARPPWSHLAQGTVPHTIGSTLRPSRPRATFNNNVNWHSLTLVSSLSRPRAPRVTLVGHFIPCRECENTQGNAHWPRPQVNPTYCPDPLPLHKKDWIRCPPLGLQLLTLRPGQVPRGLPSPQSSSGVPTGSSLLCVAIARFGNRHRVYSHRWSFRNQQPFNPGGLLEPPG